MFEAEMHKFYEVIIPSGINVTGKYHICEMLYELIKTKHTIGDDNPGYRKIIDFHYPYECILPEDWSWQFTVGGKGVYVGTFTRRVSKYVKKTFGFDLSEAELSAIGTLARDNSTSEERVQIDFDDQLNWKAGDFGDLHSCYWNGNENALKLLQMHKALAVRLWNNECTKGEGRAWLMPPETHGLGDFMIVFSASSKNYKYETLWFARLLGLFWGLEYHRVYFDGGRVSGNLYGSAYIVGKLDDVNKVDTVRLNWEPLKHADDFDDTYTCCNCGYRSRDGDQFSDNHNGDAYCNQCYEDIYVHCYHCDCELSRDEAISYNYYYYCDYHAETYLIHCDNCGDYYDKERAITLGNALLCRSCGTDNKVISMYKEEINETI